MKIRIFLIMIFHLLAPKIVGMKKIKIKSEKFKNLGLRSYSTKAFNKSILPKNFYVPASSKNDGSKKQKIALSQQLRQNKLANFFSSKKSSLLADKKMSRNTNFSRIKAKAEQEEYNQKTPYSYWQWIKRLIGAALVGATVATMQEDADLLSQPEFEDFRKFIEFVRDPELEKRWKICQANPKCNEVICNANFITIINSHPYIVLKDHQFDRVINAKLAEKVIKDNNLNLIGIPKKAILFDGNSWKVVTEKIEGISPENFSLEQVQQLTIFVLETGYTDYGPSNFIFNKKSKKLFIIDTEDQSFGRGHVLSKEEHLDDLIIYLKRRYLIAPSVTLWLTNQKKLLNNPEEKISPLPKNSIINQSFSNLNLDEVRTKSEKYATLVNKSYLNVRDFVIVNLEK